MLYVSYTSISLGGGPKQTHKGHLSAVGKIQLGNGRGVLEIPFKKACEEKISCDGDSLGGENLTDWRCF